MFHLSHFPSVSPSRVLYIINIISFLYTNLLNLISLGLCVPCITNALGFLLYIPSNLK